MNDASQPLRERYLDLLAAAVIGPLSDEEMTELESFHDKFPDIDVHDFDDAAAAALLAMTPHNIEPMPVALRKRIEAEAPRYVPQRGSSPQSIEAYESQLVSRRTSVGRRELLAWCAVAASLLLAAFGWFQSKDSGQPRVAAAERRAALLKDAVDVVQVAWAPGPQPFQQAVGGDVVWSDAHQEGYMRFTGMPTNDPSQQQYQLWIIDLSRDTEPVDGGVFDVTSDGELIVPIDAKLKVANPAAFAITIEQPGGVVVSTQEALPLLAKVKVE